MHEVTGGFEGDLDKDENGEGSQQPEGQGVFDAEHAEDRVQKTAERHGQQRAEEEAQKRESHANHPLVETNGRQATKKHESQKPHCHGLNNTNFKRKSTRKMVVARIFRSQTKLRGMESRLRPAECR